MSDVPVMHVFVLNGMPFRLHLAVVRNSPLSMRFVVSPRRVPIPMGEVDRRDTIEPGESYGAKNVPAVTVPLVTRKGFDEEPKLSLQHAKKENVRVLVFTVSPWKPGEKEAAEAARKAKEQQDP